MRIAAVCLVAALALAPAALADSKQDWDDCTSSDADVSIAGCSRIIELGDESKNNIVIAYFDRGIAHQNKGEHQDAIADFNQSLKLNPNDPAAVYRRVLNIPGGTLSEGAPADITVLAPDLPVRIEAARLRSRSKNTPFDGWQLRGGVAATIVGGRTVFVNDAFVAAGL